MNNRIAIFMPSLREGGPQKNMIRLSKGLIQEKYEVDLVLANKKGSMLALVDKNINIFDFNCKHSIWESFNKLNKYIESRKPRAVISAPERANMVLCLTKKLAKHKLNAIITVRNTLSRSFANSESWKYKRLMPRIVSMLYPYADSIVSVSNGVAEDLSNLTNIDRKQIHTIYNPVITEELYLSSSHAIQEKWYPEQNKKLIMSVGRLSKQKNYELLIESFSRLNDIENKVLLILGDGDKRKRLEALAADLNVSNKVIMPGFVLNPYKFMKKAAVFVLSSDWEGLPTVLIEAIALGVPVVSTDCPSGPREILQNGTFGKIVPMNNVDLLSQAIEETLEKPEQLVPESHIVKFSRDCAMKRYIELF